MKNPWMKLGSRNVLECDEPYVNAFNAYVERPARERQLKKASAIKINDRLLPEPFFGPFDAPVVLLMLNPKADQHADKWHSKPAYRDALLRAYSGPRGAPHFHLLDSNPGAPGEEFWRRLVQPLSTTKKACEIPIAERLLSVEYFPYASSRFDHTTPRLPSQEFSFELIRRAIRHNALVVCLSGELPWLGAVPALNKHKNFIRTGGRQRASLTAKVLGLKQHKKVCSLIFSA
jgi:hypothetical protein